MSAARCSASGLHARGLPRRYLGMVGRKGRGRGSQPGALSRWRSAMPSTSGRLLTRSTPTWAWRVIRSLVQRGDDLGVFVFAEVRRDGVTDVAPLGRGDRI